MHAMLTQYETKKELQLFREQRDQTVVSEIQQLTEKEASRPRPPFALSHNDRPVALRYLIFLMKKAERDHQAEVIYGR